MYPKQLLPLAGDKTLLQATILRTSDLPGLGEQCLVVSNEAHRFAIAEQIAGIRKRAGILLEPEGRNTAPAVGLAALEADSDDLLLVMPADHVIKDAGAFRQAVGYGIPAAESGKLVTFGIVPKSPETGYGYIKASLDGAAPVRVEAFIEKPQARAAEAYVASGDYLWNSGMFLFRAGQFLEELESLAPPIFSACKKAMMGKTIDGDFVRPDTAAFLDSPSDSIDYAVMEKSKNAVVVPLDAGWSDVGSWSALHDVSDKDEQGNSADGDVHLINCEGTFVQAESRLVAAVGLKNTVVVETKDAILVADREQSQDVKVAVDRLKEKERGEVLLGRQVFRPWGSYDSIDAESNFQVKRLIIKPGALLSLQRHAHRAEHWVCVKGVARITRNDEEFDLNPNESTYIGIGDVHRIANPYDEPCHIIEVQCGDYLGEDDIERLEDNYGREGTNT